ncbi:ammonia monooxygenase [Vibrio albus]|uniref:Ammonia monooxygenase n=1 Tax=Vibrio albus TaxID=2200953 RepID=A0A2U3BAM5_9VIBR|nr:AbrB family transcriptional regulator [Vibrio albus]PWI33838.1 ammonia monooxygenase [Vibrio albus]
MTKVSPLQSHLWLSGIRWLALLVITSAISIYLDYSSVPAAYLLGALICAITFAVLNQSVKLPKPCLTLGQGIIGVMIASSIPVMTLNNITDHWTLFTLGIGSVQLLSNGLGLLLTRSNVLPGSTAIWGTSPGAATAMTIMAESFDADVRLVALMQYLRVVIVTVTAVLVTHFWANDLTTAPQPALADFSWQITSRTDFLQTLALMAVSIIVARITRLPAGPLLITLAVGLVASATQVVHLTLPQPLLLLSYTIIGWNIGFRFDRSILAYALKILPSILLSIVLLIGGCALMSQVLVITMGIDPLTAYLAMSPGGADSVAIIAASGQADISFVMMMQTARLILVLICGPAIARWLAIRQLRSEKVAH